MLDEIVDWLQTYGLTTQQLNELINLPFEELSKGEQVLVNDYHKLLAKIEIKQDQKQQQLIKADEDNLKAANDELQKALSELDSWLEERGI